MSEIALAPVKMWLASALPAGVAEVLDRLQRTPGVARVAVMPDVHVASEFCVGTVVATENLLFPNAVGGDIGCGMLAMRFDARAEVLCDPERAARVLGALQLRCPARRHRVERDAVELPLSHPHLLAAARSRDARAQLGTLGGGNHFLELQADEEERLWLMLHTGSRHLGQAIHQHHLARSQVTETKLMALEARSEEGQAYLVDVECGRAWAKENRRRLAVAAAEGLEKVLGVVPMLETLVDIDHNQVREEEGMLVHRKGATAAREGEAGMIPGSMGTESFHVEGRGCAEALNSSSHGAGRLLSRTQAREKITRSMLRQQIRGVWYDRRMEAAMVEEAPGAYKAIGEVMRAQRELTRIVRRLRPRLIYKGG